MLHTALPIERKLYMKMRETLVLLAAGAFSTMALADCKAPSALEGKTFVNKTSSDYSPLNPNADAILLLKFEKDRYTTYFLRNGTQASGSYTYRLLAPTIGLMESREDFGGQVTDFKLTLVCLNDVSGTFVFNQEKGAIKPDVRQNTGIYTIH
jgi:hypothetical protein